VTWRSWPGHVAVARPRCTGASSCRNPPSVWRACSCGAAFACCGDHRNGRDLEFELATHRKTCALAAAGPQGRARCSGCGAEAVVTERPSAGLRRESGRSQCWDDLACRRRRR
jgi:hypothetical protein